MQGTNLVLYGLDPTSGTLRPVGTTDSGQILFAGYANSGEQQDAIIAADYITGNASGQEAFDTVLINQTIYSAEIKTNHATALLLTGYFSSVVGGGNYTLGVQAVTKVTGQTGYRSLVFGASPTFSALTGWAAMTACVTRDTVSNGGAIQLSQTILPPLIRLSLAIPNNAGHTAGFWHYSLCR